MMYGVAMGIAGGVVTVVFFSVWSSIFKRTHLGRIQGAAQTMTVLASALAMRQAARLLHGQSATPVRRVPNPFFA